MLVVYCAAFLSILASTQEECETPNLCPRYPLASSALTTEHLLDITLIDSIEDHLPLPRPLLEKVFAGSPSWRTARWLITAQSGGICSMHLFTGACFKRALELRRTTSVRRTGPGQEVCSLCTILANFDHQWLIGQIEVRRTFLVH